MKTEFYLLVTTASPQAVMMINSPGTEALRIPMTLNTPTFATLSLTQFSTAAAEVLQAAAFTLLYSPATNVQRQLYKAVLQRLFIFQINTPTLLPQEHPSVCLMLQV